MSTPLPQIDRAVPTVCRLLRTKHAFGSFDESDFDPWQMGSSTTAVFWCLATMQSSGPDDGFAHPHDCQAGRTCFQSQDE